METITQQIQEAQEAIEAIEPAGKFPPREIVFRGWILPSGQVLEEKRYVQDKLGMFPVQEFTTITTTILNNFLQGDMGIRIGELFRGEVQMPSDFSPESADKVVQDNIELIKAFVKLVEIFPDYQKDIIALSLGVRRGEREWFKDCISEPPHRGGLTVEEGFDLLTVFIQQNAKLIRRVAVGKAQDLVETFMLEVMEREPAQKEETETSSTDQTPAPVQVEPPTPGSTPSSTSSQDIPVNA